MKFLKKIDWDTFLEYVFLTAIVLLVIAMTILEFQVLSECKAQ